MDVLYHAVAAGMWAYSRAAFRVTVLGSRRLELPPGTLIVVTHRRESDVPLVCPPLYARARMWRPGALRMSFAARDDMFLPGFFAGFPPGLAPVARKALFRVDVARWLPRVRVHPIRSARVARLGEVVRARPGAALADVLAAPEVAALESRAAARALPPPIRGADVLRGDYVDLLWRAVTPAEARVDEFWSGRSALAAADFRGLVDLVRAGGVLLLFPEGRPSRDGEIGPIQRGLAALARRAAPSALLPVALAYDPLTRGRTRVTIALGDAVPPSERGVEEQALPLLRRTMPLTAGQVVAAGVDPVEAVEAAAAEGRPIEPDLLDAARRRGRLAEAAAAARRQPGEVAVLAREYRSAR